MPSHELNEHWEPSPLPLYGEVRGRKIKPHGKYLEPVSVYGYL